MEDDFRSFPLYKMGPLFLGNLRSSHRSLGGRIVPLTSPREGSTPIPADENLVVHLDAVGFFRGFSIRMFPKIVGNIPPNPSIKNRGFPEKKNIHFGGFPTIFGNTHIQLVDNCFICGFPKMLITQQAWLFLRKMIIFGVFWGVPQIWGNTHLMIGSWGKNLFGFPYYNNVIIFSFPYNNFRFSI